MALGAIFKDETGKIVNTGGGILQQKVAITTSVFSGMAVIPNDNTIPQNTEGTEIVTVTITPKSLSSRLRVIGIACLYGSAGDYPATLALFRDSVADAIASTVFHGSASGASYAQGVPVGCDIATPSLSSITFKMRAGGASGGGSVGCNRDTNGNSRGGTETSLLEVVEYIP